MRLTLTTQAPYTVYTMKFSTIVLFLAQVAADTQYVLEVTFEETSCSFYTYELRVTSAPPCSQRFTGSGADNSKEKRRQRRRTSKRSRTSERVVTARKRRTSGTPRFSRKLKSTMVKTWMRMLSDAFSRDPVYVPYELSRLDMFIFIYIFIYVLVSKRSSVSN
eukprot:GEMP01088614.1.p1 GENE.GEMP01088614.1~~GEMP01088614.1.p1  ORF type:complete len:163 (+),score=10.74 GEMP01088614.1:91-579(+)